MQTVSENWKNVHKRTLLNESFVEVSLNIADPESVEDASPQDNGAVYISNSSDLTNGGEKTPPPYCTLEQNMWCLDGSRSAIPESDFGDSSYIGDVLSDENCIFNMKVPVITINFSKVFTKSIPGITITWSPTYGEFADTFTVIAYNGNRVVAEKDVFGNKSVKSLILTEITGYNRIVVIVRKWCLPNHRARVEGIFVGLNKVYGKADLFDYSHSQSVDPLSTSLPKFEIKFSVDNVSREYNLNNPNGLAKYLSERQEVKARYGLKMDDGSVEWIKGGTFYLSEWYAKQNGLTADFTARDLLEFMSDIYYDEPDWYTQERTLYDIAEKILQQADLPLNPDGTNKWVIDDILRDIYFFAPVPEDTLANCLQLVANAGGCVLYQDRDGILHIEEMKVGYVDYEINSFNSYSKPEITLSKPIKQVNVKIYSYTVDGNKVDYTTTEYVRVVGTSGETITVDNPLINDDGLASWVAQWAANHLRNRMTIDSSWRADVRLDALDTVKIENDFGKQGVRMTDVEFTYNGAFRATGEGKVIGYG